MYIHITTHKNAQTHTHTDKERKRDLGREGKGTDGERGVSVYVIMCIRVWWKGKGGREGEREVEEVEREV